MKRHQRMVVQLLPKLIYSYSYIITAHISKYTILLQHNRAIRISCFNHCITGKPFSMWISEVSSAVIITVVKDLSTLTQAISLHVCSIDLGNSSRHDSSKIWGLTAASSLCKSIQCRHVQDYGVFFPHFSIKSVLETKSQESGHQCIGGLSMNNNNQFLNRIYHLIPYSHEKDSNWLILLNLF